MNPNDLATRYHLLNSSFKKTMIYHIGIDAGFFTEYTYTLIPQHFDLTLFISS